MANLTKLEDRLREMKGKPFLYNTKPVDILSYQIDSEYCTLVLSVGPWITKPAGEMIKLLADFLPVEQETMPVVASVTAPQVQSTKAFTKLTEIMLDNIKRVQENRDYVEQASQVNASVKTMIDMAKTEIEAIKAVNEFNRSR